MHTTRGKSGPTFDVVANAAHSFGVMLLVNVWTSGDLGHVLPRERLLTHLLELSTVNEQTVRPINVGLGYFLTETQYGVVIEDIRFEGEVYEWFKLDFVLVSALIFKGHSSELDLLLWDEVTIIVNVRASGDS